MKNKSRLLKASKRLKAVKKPAAPKKPEQPPVQKDIFSKGRLIRLIITSWALSLAVELLVAGILNAATGIFSRPTGLLAEAIFFAVGLFLGITFFGLLTRSSFLLSSRIGEAIGKMAKGNFSVRLKKTGNEDIDAIVSDFNKMAKELNSLYILNSEFVANFSHEFKTPIVSIKGYAELLKESDGLSESDKQFLDVIIEESNRLATLSESTITLSKLDSDTVEKNKTAFWLDEQLNRCILLFDNQLNEKSITLAADVDRVKIRAYRNLTQEIWINLLSNAMKFTPRGGTINVTLKEHGGVAFVTVTDSGAGIGGDNLKRVFRRSFQEDTPHKSSGSGLGLAITQRIVELHSGTIFAENAPSGGARFVVRLPVE